MFLLFVSLAVTAVISHGLDFAVEVPGTTLLRQQRETNVTFEGICHGDRAKVIGGKPTRIEQVPYQASIRHKHNPRDSVWDASIICGGSLISPKVILTAAHCFRNHFDELNAPIRYAVILGSTFRTLPSTPVQVRAVQKIVVHRDYHALPHVRNDIALMLLKQPAKLTDSVKTIPLTTVTPQPGLRCLISGYGRTNLYDRTYAPCLMKAVVPVQDTGECRQRSSIRIGSGFICAGYFEGGIDACIGDSGGPLVCYGVQYGIVSHGVECAKENEPGIYTDVALYQRWIRENSDGSSTGSQSVVLGLLQFLVIWIPIWREF